MDRNESQVSVCVNFSDIYKISNQEVLQRVSETKTRLNTVKKRKHVVRACASARTRIITA